ncbi:MAG: UDP-3-O-acyl-N-acetylglucosamine deacetylase [Armatimonadota bacterium]|nr:UDP-3-O-acyl-N-acetylglucosamine deacetylase [Armatimonadota bacterium]MDR7426452.1 UDP-3-O-acyl-N-acetylglucosamine deacetylase [Armatimonadota bacterium]MDR7464689.1 UDP-3-O-acyl-N-acetylglucosamine deacetylase [Armatimonadota bacterium]MDR7470252.1 UDP-3-O-acyl-N-acetylglucosamine deacetylase [Armatimonadota bacterium]MDR7473409.1 UDP-3-O-acyl-N-acetylglucosamine deacetylase [Armatimonadota bacterium]
MPIRQRTITRAVSLSGVGVHSGAAVRVRLLGAPPGAGVIFSRCDLGPGALRATLENVRSTRRGVTLGDGVTVASVEHLLAAAAGLCIDNLQVEVEGPELPALDGSAAGYVEALAGAGIVEQEEPARVIELGEVEVTVGDARAVTRAGGELRVRYIVDLPPPLGRQVATADLSVFATAIAPARTWGFVDEAATLRAAGLARGAGPGNVLVIAAGGYLNPPRFADEPVRHKILDLLGDLALLGARLHGYVEVVRGGHALHVALAREIARRWGERNARTEP